MFLVLETDYVDLTCVKAPEAKKFVPNNAAVINNSWIKKDNDEQEPEINSTKKIKTVTFGENKTYYIQKYFEEYDE